MPFDITETYKETLRSDPELTMPVAAIEALVLLIRTFQPLTSAELVTLVEQNVKTLKQLVPNLVSLSAGCDLFVRFIHRNLHLYSDWDACRRHLVENGEEIVQRAKQARDDIAAHGVRFVADGNTVLVHLYLRVVLAVLLRAAQQHVRFRVIVTEASLGHGEQMAAALRALGIPVALIPDSAVGLVINEVSKVFVGAEGVAESGGVVNSVGSYQIGVLASVLRVPFYVVAESHKFVRMYPLAPDDVPNERNVLRFSTEEVPVERGSVVDFTPHKYITALITDLGVLTPSAVSEELIKMWYD